MPICVMCQSERFFVFNGNLCQKIGNADDEDLIDIYYHDGQSAGLMDSITAQMEIFVPSAVSISVG